MSRTTSGRRTNNAGVVVGSIYLGGNSYEGYIDNNGVVTILQDPASTSSITRPYGINNAGNVVGSYDNQHGFLYHNGTYTTFDDPLGVNGTVAQGINDNGLIVGFYADANNKHHGFIDNGGVFTTVDDPLGVNGTVLSGINDAGAAVGYYIDVNNVTHGFVANPTVTISFVLTSGGLDFQSNNPLKEMGAGAIQPGGSSTSFTIVDAAAGHEFVLDGSGFTYGTDINGGITVTGGTLTSFHELTNDSTPVPLADFTGLLVNAAMWMTDVKLAAGGDTSAIDALTSTFAYNFVGGSGPDTFGSAGHADTLSGTGVDFFDGGGAPAGYRDTETGGAGSTFVFGKGYGALTITNFDQDSNGNFSQNIGDHIELNGLSAPLIVNYVNGNTVADFGNGDVLTLLNFDPANIVDADFTGNGGGNGNGGNNNGPVINNANNSVTYTGTPVFLDQSIAVTDTTGTVNEVNAWISSSSFQIGDIFDDQWQPPCQRQH